MSVQAATGQRGATPAAPAAVGGSRAASRPPAPQMMPGGLAPADAGALRLPAQHFAAAMLFLVAGAVGLVIVAPDVAAGDFPSPRVAGVTHLFTLGWLTTTIFGALHQLLPVALGAPIRSRVVGQLAFWSYAPGALLFSFGVALVSTVLHHVGIALLATGILLTVGNVAMSMKAARTRDVTWWAVAIALAFLVSTLLLGVLLLHNLHTGFLREMRVVTLAVHLHVALVGWALVTMIGMSHRLLPMFLLAHGADTRWTRRALWAVPPGLLLLCAGLVHGVPLAPWAGLALLEAAVVFFLLQCRAFYRKKMRPRLDVGLRFAFCALGFLAVSGAMAPAVLAMGGIREPRLATAYVLIGLLGGIVLYVVGFFYKIVPFLAWIARFRSTVGRERVPTVAELYSARVADVQLVVMVAAVATLGAGVLIGSALAVRLGALAFAAGVALHAVQIARVARGGRLFTHVRPVGPG